METRDIRDVLGELLQEAFDAPNYDSTWFIDAEKGSDLLGTLDRLGATDASTPASPGTQTIAGHVEHLRTSLHEANRAFGGQPFDVDWEASWSVQEVDEDAWQRLRLSLREEFIGLMMTLRERPSFSRDELKGLAATLAHSAWHLGAIRQLARLVPAATETG